MADRLVRRIALFSAITGAVCALVLGVKYGPMSGLSSLAGTVLGVLNFWALARLVTILLDSKNPSGQRGRAAVFLGAKSIALITVVGVLVVNGWVRGGALMAGLSTVALSIVLGGLLQGGATDEPEGKTPTDPASRPRDDQNDSDDSNRSEP